MPKLNGKGPENKGCCTGRSLGNCQKNKGEQPFGQGQGKRRKAGIIDNKNKQNN